MRRYLNHCRCCVLVLLSVGFVAACEISKNDFCAKSSIKCTDVLGDEEPSYFIINSKGRLGNHLIAYVLIQAFAKTLKIRPLITKTTHQYLSQYFEGIVGGPVGVYEEIFCEEGRRIPLTLFEESVDALIENTEIRTGKVVELWPRNYMPDAKECCPGLDLHRYIENNFIDELKETLTFKEDYLNHARQVKEKVARELGKSAEELMFVGVHNRRTDYLEYMEHMYGTTKNPFTKSYFKSAMSYFREEAEDDSRTAVFLFVSDDMPWARKNIKSKLNDVFFAGLGDADIPDAVGRDLALLASCEHTITTWGSFSMWAAMLAGGEYYSQYGVIVPGHLQNKKAKKKKKV